MNTKNLLTKIAFGFIILVGAAQVSFAQNWQVVWQDEFTTGISADWNFEVNGDGGGNNELQYYRQENASVQNGSLVITAKQESFGGKNYTSARMTTQNKKTFTYGKIEARIAVPSVQGIWPAFWMLGSSIGSVGWPSCGEIDIMEHVNTGNTCYGTVHWSNASNAHQYITGQTEVTPSITDYHVYTVIWNANNITWYVDGNQYHQVDITNGVNGTSEFQSDFFILLNLAVGGDWPGFSIGAMPSNMYVDYVRVYQDAGTVTIQPTTDVVTVYKDCNYGGFSGGLAIGDYNLAALNALGVLDNDVSSLHVAQGYKAILFQDDNFGGTSTVINSDNACLNTTWNDNVSSIRILADGATNMQGAFFLQNRNSGLFMDVAGGEGSMADGANVQQWNTAATNNQLFDFTHLGDGIYSIAARHSGKVLDVDAAKRDNGANVQQWQNFGSVNQQFIVYPTGDGYYKLIPRFSGKVVEVAGASTALEGNVQQWDNNNQTCGQWKLVGPSTGLVTAYIDCNYGGFSGGFGIGNYTKYQLGAMGIREDGISSLHITEGYQAILYQDDNFGGATTVINSDNSCLNTIWNDQVSSMRVIPNGATNMAGTYQVQNRNSGLYLDVLGSSTADGANVIQGNSGLTNEQFNFTHLGNGVYQILAVHSGKSIDVDAMQTTDGANVQQWTYLGSANQQFIVVPTGDGFYKLVAEHSGKIVEVANSGMNVGDNVQQWTNNNQTCGQWKFKPVTAAGTGTGLEGNYFNGMNFETPVFNSVDATINFDWGFGSPNAAVNADQFSTRWTGQIQPKYSEEYTFYVTSDNGRRLWINNQLIIDKWIDDVSENSGKITLVAGQKYEIRLEYFENNGGATCKMEWTSFMQDREVVPATQLYPNSLPTLSITTPINNQKFTPPANINITANTNDSDGSIAKVEFYNGTVLLGTSTVSPYSFAWSGVAAGNYTIRTRAYDNRGGVTVSAPVLVSVQTNDCAGVANGTATTDVCGVCVGGTTGKTTLDTDKDGTPDCIDTDDDNDGVSDAADCAPLDPAIKGKTTWYADTDGDGFGDPNVTQLSCTKPTGYVADKTDACPADANKAIPGNCGCGKTELSCLDCAGVANGAAVFDNCQVCVGGTTGKEACTKDCNGDWGGTAVMDVCNVCAGGNTGITPKTNLSQCVTTGINSATDVSITAIPQPFDNTTSIKVTKGEIIGVTIIDAKGSVVYNQTDLHTDHVDVGESLANGMYTVIVYTENSMSNIKILKLK